MGERQTGRPVFDSVSYMIVSVGDDGSARQKHVELTRNGYCRSNEAGVCLLRPAPLQFKTIVFRNESWVSSSSKCTSVTSSQRHCSSTMRLW